jgi:hypothetical protein
MRGREFVLMGMKRSAGRVRVRLALCVRSALLASLAACASRDVPARYPESMPASPEAVAPRAPAAAVALAEGTTSHVPQSVQDAGQPPAHSHAHGAGHGH